MKPLLVGYHSHKLMRSKMTGIGGILVNGQLVNIVKSKTGGVCKRVTLFCCIINLSHGSIEQFCTIKGPRAILFSHNDVVLNPIPSEEGCHVEDEVEKVQTSISEGDYDDQVVVRILESASGVTGSIPRMLFC